MMILFFIEKLLGIFLLTISFTDIYTSDVIYSSNTSLSNDLRLSLSQRAIFNGSLTLDGAGYFYDFPCTPDPVVIINDGFQTTFENILLRNLSDVHINLGVNSGIIFGNNSVVQFLTDQALTHIYNFSGNATIVGNSNTLDLTNGQIYVGANSCLTISNLSLTHYWDSVNGHSKLQCVDNTGSIKFENVLLLSEQLMWTMGSFVVSRALEISGGALIYSSEMGSTIDDCSKLILANSTLWYASTNATNLTFTNTSSWLALDYSFIILSVDLFLRKGSLALNGYNFLFPFNSLTNGIYIGDGVSANNNMVVKNFSSQISQIMMGDDSFIIYQNVD